MGRHGAPGTASESPADPVAPADLVGPARFGSPRRLVRPVAVAAGLALVFGAGWFGVAHRDSFGAAGPETCPTTLTVITASSFAPVLAAAGRTLRSGRDCVELDIKISEGRSAAGDLAQSHADAWIPDDAAWSATVASGALAPAHRDGSGDVLALSPIYLVTDPATAERVKAAGSSWLGLSNLLTQPADPGLRLVVRDPSTSGDGMVAAGAVGEAVWDAKGMDASSLALADTQKVTHTVRHDLAATPEQAGDIGLIPEYALLPTMAVADASPRVYLAPADHTATLRFTWFPAAAALRDGAKAHALDRLRRAFDTDAAQRARHGAGLRGPDDIRPAQPGAEKLPAVTAEPFPVLAPHHVQHVFATWDPEDRRSNLLIVVDIAGGSTTGASSALDVLRDGSREVAGLLPDGSRLGLWEVGPGLDPQHPYRKLVPTARLDDALRTHADEAVTNLAAHPPGPGLAEAIADAYSSVRDDYQPDLLNQVIVFTDDHAGDSADAATVNQLGRRLTALLDPKRPVHLSVVVLGQPEVAERLKGPLDPVGAYVGTAGAVDDIKADFIHVVAGGLHG
jgi:hypothetical protein